MITNAQGFEIKIKEEEICQGCKIRIHSADCPKFVEVVKGIFLCFPCYNAENIKKLKERGKI